MGKTTNKQYVPALRFPFRNRLSFSARRIKRRRQSRSGAPAHVVKEATAGGSPSLRLV
jgi:hypothetical protein